MFLTAIAISNLRIMATRKRKAGAARRYPKNAREELLFRVAGVLRREINARFARDDGTLPTQREIADELNVQQPVLNELLNARGSLGIIVLLRLRESLQMTIDELLDLEPLVPDPPNEPPARLLRRSS